MESTLALKVHTLFLTYAWIWFSFHETTWMVLHFW